MDVTAALELTLDDDQHRDYLSASELLDDYFADLLRTKKGTPGDDLISDVAGSDSLSQGELVRNLALLLIAGFETTTNLIGNGMMILFKRPDRLRRLESEPELAASYVEEFLRFDAPVQLTSRVARAPTVVKGYRVEPGSLVVALIGSANRDETKFARAADFDPAREGNTSLSFGAGAHFCLGNALARMEAQIAFPILLRELAGLELAGEPVRRQRLVLRGYESLPVSWTG
jgi:cytochrome P450